jgi:hypothetical protein
MPSIVSQGWLAMAALNRSKLEALARCLQALIVLAVLTSAASAAPQIKSVSLRGLQSGATTSLVIDGGGLLGDATLTLGVSNVRQTIKPGATDNRLEVDVTLDERAPSGLYLLRVVNADGVSNSIPIGIDSLVQAAFTERAGSLPIALTGSVSGDQSAKTTFSGKQGETITIEVEARRLESQLNPVIHLYDARGVQIAWAQGAKKLGGDVRLTASLPNDGDYTIELHDALYQGRSPGQFRLKVGQFRYADLAFPSAIRKGLKGTVQFLGTNLPTETKVEVEAPSHAQFFPTAWPENVNVTGGRPSLLASEWDEIVEAALSDGALQLVAVPSGVHGRLLAPREEDRYRIAVQAGQKIRIETHALRLGSPLDGVLSVYDASGGNVLATNDDQPGMADPGLDFVVPSGADAIIVGIKDLLGRGGEDFAYRLTVQPQDRPDFSLSLTDDRINVPRGGKALLRVGVARKGYDGPIDLVFEGLPSGISVDNPQIPAGTNVGLILLSATGDTPAHGMVSLFGRPVSSQGATDELLRTALLPSDPLSERQPWLREQFAVASSSPSGLQLAWEPSTSDLPLGAKLIANVKATRGEKAIGPVRLTLLTSQETPKKTIKENNQDKQVDDVDRTLRLEGTPAIAADQSEAAAGVLIPADLADVTYSLVLRGELLAADGKQVLVTAYAPVISARPSRPVALELTGTDKIDVRAGLGETGKLTGKIVRQPSFNHPLRVTLTGLPRGVIAPIEDLPADKNEFELAVRLPHGSRPGPLNNVQLVALSLNLPGDRIAPSARTAFRSASTWCRERSQPSSNRCGSLRTKKNSPPV